MQSLTDQLSGSAPDAAQRLLGALLINQTDGVIGRIVETEAYDQDDAASHSARGETPRTKIMFGPAGFMYVYFTYGMHYCCNVVCGPAGRGAAVLIRAIEPLEGTERMSARRGGITGVNATNGPAKLCQAYAITTDFNGHDLRRPPLELVLQPALGPDRIIATTRIGISRAVDVPWRFYIRDNPYVSRVHRAV